MRRAARVDNNQKEIVDALRKAGRAVLHLHAVGMGCPDLLVSRFDKMWLMEIKSQSGKLTRKQEEFHDAWLGKPILIVRNAKDAIELTK